VEIQSEPIEARRNPRFCREIDSQEMKTPRHFGERAPNGQSLATVIGEFLFAT
jgi:hypothetical protein